MKILATITLLFIGSILGIVWLSNQPSPSDYMTDDELITHYGFSKLDKGMSFDEGIRVVWCMPDHVQNSGDDSLIIQEYHFGKEHPRTITLTYQDLSLAGANLADHNSNTTSDLLTKSDNTNHE